MLAVVVSRADPASEHVGEHLLEATDWQEHRDSDRPDAEGGGTYYCTDDVEVRTFDALHLHLDGVAGAFSEPDLLFFASRHSGETGPLLSAHATGNFGPAEFGGRDGELARAAPNALVAIRSALAEHAPDGYEVGIECTHHGPTDVGCPSLFVELGSGEAEWDDPAGAAAVARAILDCRGVPADRGKQLVGFGGGHYAPRFERVLRETDWAVGHVAADWSLEELVDPPGGDVLAQAFERSAAEYALVDGERPALRDAIEDLGYRAVSETWVRETDGVPLPTVQRLEARLRPVDDGLRFGEAAAEPGTADAVDVVDLPAELAAAAANVDRDAARAAVAARSVAFETEEGGTRPAGRVALAETSEADVVRALADVLRTGYDAVAVREDRVVACETVFDPEAARELGVEPGPAFGRLAAGEPVAVDGRLVEPDEVRTAREVSFPR